MNRPTSSLPARQRLDSTRVRAELAARQIPQWWIAEQIGVSRRTVTRWLAARAPRVDRIHVQRIAELLECRPIELAADADLPRGSAADRQAAARALAAPGALDRFAERHEFALFETLARAELDVALPDAERGRLYRNLGLALFRQSKLKESRPCFAEAARLASSAGDDALALSAGMQLSYASYLAGSVGECLRLDRANLLAATRLGHPAQIAANYSNVGDLLREAGHFEQARAHQVEGLRRYKALDRIPSVVFCELNMAALELDESRPDRALVWAEQARQSSEAGGFLRGEADALLAHAAALPLSEADAGPGLLARALERYAQLGIDEPRTYAQCCLISRRAGDPVAAIEHAKRGLQRERIVGNLPARARLLFEGAQALRAQGARRRFRDWRRKCLGLYRRADIPARAALVADALAD